jgi:hypothetical protein
MPQPRQYASSAARQAAYRARCEKARRETLLSQGLPAFPAVATLPGWARWNASLAAAQALLAQVSQEMQDYYDARSETWQESERGEAFTERQEAIEALSGELQTLLL